MKKLKRETEKKPKELSAEEQVIVLKKELSDVKQVLNDILLTGEK